MARLRPFRGLRYTLAAGDAGPLLAPPASTLTPAEREGYAVRSAYNAVLLASPEGHGDDRSKFIRYARSAARLAEWRRQGLLGIEERPAFYRLIQRFGPEQRGRTTLLAVVDPSMDIELAQASEARVREDRLRLLEATRTIFEPSVVYYRDPEGAIRKAVGESPVSSEASVSLGNVSSILEKIDDAQAVERIQAGFENVPLLVADGVEGFEAATEFGGAALVALASLDDPSSFRLAVHRVVRRFPGGREAILDRLAERFSIEEHHNRNLIVHVDRASAEGRAVFGLATEGGRGYLLRPITAIDGVAAEWLYREVLAPIFGFSDADPNLSFTDPVQAIRAADEGAAAAFILPRPGPNDVLDVRRTGGVLPAGSSRAYPAIPTGLVFWSMGDEA